MCFIFGTVWVQDSENFDRDDQAADEWRAREIAKDIAKRKVRRV